MSLSSQQTRVLRSLRAAGPRGITRVDWTGAHGTPDGREPILNLAARILELKNAGYVIEERKGERRDRCKAYVLSREPVRVVDRRVPDDRLFTPPADSAVTAA